MQALLGRACGTGIDVWSLGCLLAEVALQRPLFPVATAAELVHQVNITITIVITIMEVIIIISVIIITTILGITLSSS